MAKRFIDTGLFEDEWFSELSTNGKLFWVYYLTRCDHAGILKYNRRLMEFQTGIKNIDTVVQEIGNRLVRVNEQLLFCPKFIEFQYPDFPKSKVKQQDSAHKILLSLNLIDEHGNLNSTLTVKKELKNSYVNGNVIDNGNESGNECIGDESFETFWELYAKKVDRKATERAWKRIKKSLHDTIFAHVRDYVASTPDVKFRKNPASYLNANAWENEIITPFERQTTPLTEDIGQPNYDAGF